MTKKIYIQMDRQMNLATLPEDVVLLIKEYAFDMLTRISVYLSGCRERDPHFCWLQLFRPLSKRQRTTIFDWCCRQKLPTIAPIFTYQTHDGWAPGHLFRLKKENLRHPIIDEINKLMNNEFRVYDSHGQMHKLADILIFLSVTEIGDSLLDQYMKQMAYHLLVGVILMVRRNKEENLYLNDWRKLPEGSDFRCPVPLFV